MSMAWSPISGAQFVEPNQWSQRDLRLNLRPAPPLQLSSHLSTQLSTLDTLSEHGC